MSPVLLRCGVRAAAVVAGVGGVALASVHVSGHHFPDVFVVGAVIFLTLVAGIWLMTELVCPVAEGIAVNGAEIARVRVETQARYEALQASRSDAEAIGAWAAWHAARELVSGDGERAEVVGLNGHRRR